jgi:hypothetical protein
MTKIIPRINKSLKVILSKVGHNSKPDFIIIGAQKAGASGLFDTLNKHTLISGSDIKEVHFFDRDEVYLNRKISSYHSYFPLSYALAKGCKVFEAIPLYLFHPEVPKRLYDYSPNLKLIVTLRNSIERAYSTWRMFNHNGKAVTTELKHDGRSFEDAIKYELANVANTDVDPHGYNYVGKGLYVEQLENIFTYFTNEQVLILENKENSNWEEGTSIIIQNFVDVSFENMNIKKSNISKIREDSQLEPIKELLREYFAAYNQQLFNFIGKKYDWQFAK